jgi:delta 1-pyrroline-5-carboxylate dehydrogenase
MTTFTSVNPARPSDVVGTFDAVSDSRVRATVEEAAAAQRSWASLRVAERAALIGGIAHVIARQTHTFVDLIVRENGKPTGQATAEVQRQDHRQRDRAAVRRVEVVQLGRVPEGGRQALEFFTDTKTVYLLSA